MCVVVVVDTVIEMRSYFFVTLFQLCSVQRTHPCLEALATLQMQINLAVAILDQLLNRHLLASLSMALPLPIQLPPALLVLLVFKPFNLILLLSSTAYRLLESPISMHRVRV